MRMVLAALAALIGLQFGPAAAVTFEFTETGSGRVLAEMDISSPAPFTASSIDAFRITPEGSSVFGLAAGPLLSPLVQDRLAMQFSDQFEADGGLSTGVPGTANEVSTDLAELGVDSDAQTLTEDDFFVLFFSDTVDDDDQLQLFVDGFGLPTQIFAFGDWERSAVVPLPGAAILLLGGLGALAAIGRRRA
ncbi:MAG: hypothetical protein AAFQ75_13915 [Pseudomonadota bacterium]